MCRMRRGKASTNIFIFVPLKYMYLMYMFLNGEKYVFCEGLQNIHVSIKKKSQYENKYYVGNMLYIKVYNISNKLVKR